MSRFFVADSGRVWAGGACGTDPLATGRNDSTVLVVTVSHSATGGWGFEVWDTDPASTAGNPTWLPAATAGYYRPDDNACFMTWQSTDPVDVPWDSWGDLVPPNPNPGSENFSLSTIAVDPAGEWIFGFFPSLNMGRRWGCANIFRAHLPFHSEFPAGTALEWEPFQEYTDLAGVAQDNLWSDPGSHAARRRPHVYPMGSYVEDEPMPEFFATTYVQDAAFVPGATTSLLMGSAFHWWVFEHGHTFDAEGAGWNTQENMFGPDLDEAAFVMAFAGQDSQPVFQDLSSHAIAVCPGCAPSLGNRWVDRVIGGGTGDYKYANLYGEQDDGWQEPAERPCEFHMITDTGRDVEVWVDRADEGSASQAWAIFQPQGHFGDPDPNDGVDVSLGDANLARGIFFSDPEAGSVSVLGDEWCWDGVAKAGTTGFVSGQSYLQASSGWEILCLDSDLVEPGQHGFPACSDDPVEPRQMAIGLPVALEVLGPDTALVAAVASRPNDQEFVYEDEDLAGLWTVEHTSTGLTYIELAYAGPIAADCTKEEFFQHDSTFVALNGITIAPHDTSGATRAFVSSRASNCGVAEVQWEPGAEAAAEWRAVDLSACTFQQTTDPTEPLGIYGVTASSDGRWLFAWGGLSSRAPAVTAVCAVDLDSWDPGTETYDPAEAVVSNTDLPLHVTSFVSHPHVADTWFLGGYTQDYCTDCIPSAVFVLQRRERWDAGSGAWEAQWGFTPIASKSLQARIVTDIDLGPGEGSRWDPIQAIYLATSGGSWWNGRFAW